MNWQEVREKYKDRWLLIEALESESKDGKRRILDMSIINDYDTGKDALKEYSNRHKKDKNREMYVYHTKHTDLTIEERLWIGVRQNGN